MSKKKLFDDDSEEDIALTTENEYAKKYDTWREKEEIHKLEQKYGPDAMNSEEASSSESEDDSDVPPEVNEEMETQFLKTLALLKTKDPRIYDPEFKCFDEDKEKAPEKPSAFKTLTFEDSDDDDDKHQGADIFKIEKKAEIDDAEVDNEVTEHTTSKKRNIKGGKIKEYLTGQADHIDDEVEKDLAPLKALWSDPKLNEGEAFLRDYILNKRYLDTGGADADCVRDDAELEADARTVEEQGQFERAYNFRFEEPDDEYLKRFPRTMNSIRPKDDRRARKRAEVRARKEEEKQRKMDEIARLKALKLKEIREKIAKIKEVTGNQELAFKEEDIEGDFDPSEHDRRMRALFDDEYYGHTDADKPRFPDLDRELEIENWDKYDEDNGEVYPSQDDVGMHCEDDDFNMDADYDPKRVRAGLLEEIQKTLGKKRRSRKRPSRLAQLLTKEKPKFLPLAAERTYAQHMEEYYQLDCEDVVGGLPTRFKYREVEPNDYGLSVEEILLADDAELTQWVPLKRLVKIRPRAAELADAANYKQRSNDQQLKRRLLPSLYRALPQDPEIVEQAEGAKKNKKERKETSNNVNVTSGSTQPDTVEDAEGADKKRKIKKKTEESDNNDNQTSDCIEPDSVEPVGSAEKKRKKKKKGVERSVIKTNDYIQPEPVVPVDSTEKKNRKRKNEDKTVNHDNETNGFIQPDITVPVEGVIKKRKKDQIEVETSQNQNETSGTLQHDVVVPVEGTKKKRKKKKEGEVTANNSNVTNRNIVPDTVGTVTGTIKKNKDNKSATNKKNKKLKLKNKIRNKRGSDVSNENPLGKLSDGRLKAYGLNPKKYRGFLKYKKF